MSDIEGTGADEEQTEEFGDEGAGPEEPADVLEDPENKAAAEAIRESTTKEGD